MRSRGLVWTRDGHHIRYIDLSQRSLKTKHLLHSRPHPPPSPAEALALTRGGGERRSKPQQQKFVDVWTGASRKRNCRKLAPPRHIRTKGPQKHVRRMLLQRLPRQLQRLSLLRAAALGQPRWGAMEAAPAGVAPSVEVRGPRPARRHAAPRGPGADRR